jgi:Xaa-Pro dipeptidase
MPLGDRVHPITPEEFHARILRAQELMAQANPKVEALLIGSGSSLVYFTGIRWWPSERLLAFVIPRTGDPIIVSPAFEEARARIAPQSGGSPRLAGRRKSHQVDCCRPR